MHVLACNLLFDSHRLSNFTALYFLGLDVFDICTLKIYRHCCLPDGPKLKDVRTCWRQFTRVKLFSNERHQYRDTVHIKINNFIFVCVCIYIYRIHVYLIPYIWAKKRKTCGLENCLKHCQWTIVTINQSRMHWSRYKSWKLTVYKIWNLNVPKNTV